MTRATEYHEALFAQIPNRGGVYSLVISTLDDPPGATFIGLRPDGLVISRTTGAAGGPAAALAPFAATTIDCVLIGEGLDSLVGRGDDYARFDVYKLDGGGAREWHEASGFLRPETFVDYPGRGDKTVRLSAADGVGMALGNRFVVDPSASGYDGDDTEALVETVRRTLAELATADGVAGRLVTRCGIRPAGLVGDPLAGLYARARAWVDADEAVLFEDAAVRTTSGRFNCRVFQTRGRVDEGGVRYVVQQRSLYAAGGPVVTHTYDLATGALLATTSDDLVFDGTGLVWSPDTERARLLPVASVDAAYSFGQDLDDVTANGSFETEGSQGAGTAAHWSFSGADASAPVGPSYCRRVELPADGIGGSPGNPGGLEPTFGDEHALQFTDDGGLGFARPVAAQGGYAVVPREDGSAVRVEVRMHFTPAGNFTEAHQTSPSRLRIEVDTPAGPASLHRDTVRARADVLKGAEARVPVDGVLDGFGGAAGGVPVALPGAVLRFEGTDLEGGRQLSRLTLTRPLYVSSTVATGDLDEDLYSGALAEIVFFAAGSDGIELLDLVEQTSGAREITLSGTAPAVTVDGTPVEGGLLTWFQGAKIDAGAAEAVRSRETWHVGSVAVAPTAGEDGRSAVTGQVDRVGVATSGSAVVVPTSDTQGLRIGDGPLPDFPGALLVDRGAGLVPTAQGDSTAWENAAEPGYTAGSIGEATARDALRQLAGVDADGNPSLLRRWSGVLELNGQDYDAEQALRLTHPGGTPALYVWDEMGYYVAADQLRVVATEVRLADLDAVGGALHEIELLT